MKNDLKQQEQNYVYVLDINGNPLMPTKRFKKVRELKKQGLAKVVFYDPFTIQMLYDVGTETQKLTMGIDSGTSYVGASVVNEEGKEFLSATFNTNTLDIKSKMQDRASHRHTRNRHNRDKKKRRAKANGTTFEGIRYFYVSGAETETPSKLIKSKLCRLDKKVDSGKLSNTASHCLDNHINIVNKLAKVLPIVEFNVEYAEFDTHRLVNPSVYGSGYQKGTLYDELNHKAFVLKRDNHTCVLCKSKKKGDKLEVHHVVHRSDGGADHYNNLVTLHDKCHKKVHNNKKTEQKLLDIIKKKGILDNQVITRPSTILNSVMSRFVDYLEHHYGNVNLTYGFETKAKRYEYDIEKTHNNDAYLVALSDNTPSLRAKHTIYNQYARNARTYIYVTKQRRYSEKVGEKWKPICYNRNKAMAQPKDSLAEYREKYGEKAVSKLRVTKGMRTFVDRSGYVFEAGDLVVFKRKMYVVAGNSNGGIYVRLTGQGSTNFKPRDLKLLEKHKGFRRVNW